MAGDAGAGDGLPCSSWSRSSVSRSRRNPASVSALTARSLASASCWPASWRLPSWSSMRSQASRGTIMLPAGTSGWATAADGGVAGVAAWAWRISAALSTTELNSTRRPCSDVWAGTRPPSIQALTVASGDPMAAAASLIVTHRGPCGAGVSGASGRSSCGSTGGTGGGADRRPTRRRSASVSHTNAGSRFICAR